MRALVLKLSVVVVSAITLSACNATTGILAANEPAHISAVNVSLAPALTTSASFADRLRAQTTQEARRFGRAGAAKEIRIAVQRHSYKNAAMSLLVGDANYAGAKIAVVDVASGRVQGEAEVSAIDSLAINGIAGAIIAAAQDKQKVDQRLAENLSWDVMAKVYGSAAASQARKQAEANPAPAAPAAPETAPAAPAKDVPVASANKRRVASARPATASVAR